MACYYSYLACTDIATERQAKNGGHTVHSRILPSSPIHINISSSACSLHILGIAFFECYLGVLGHEMAFAISKSKYIGGAYVR